MDNDLDALFRALNADSGVVFQLRREFHTIRDERERAIDGLRRIDRIVGNAVGLGPESCSAIRHCLFDVLRTIVAPLEPNEMGEPDVVPI